MTRAGSRFGLRSAVIVLALGTAGLVAGCGGGGSEPTISSTDTTPPGATKTTTAEQGTGAGQSAPRRRSAEKREKAPSHSSQGEKTKDGAQGGKVDGATVPPISSAPQEGSEGPAPGVATSKGGDNSVQTYGAESSDGEREQAAIAVQGFLDARAAGEWGKACSYLTAPTLTSIEQLAKRSQSQGSEVSGCAGVMQALNERIPEEIRRQSARIERVLSFRIEGDQGFLLFIGPPTATLFSVPMNLEGGIWKVGSLTPNPLAV